MLTASIIVAGYADVDMDSMSDVDDYLSGDEEDDADVEMEDDLSTISVAASTTVVGCDRRPFTGMDIDGLEHYDTLHNRSSPLLSSYQPSHPHGYYSHQQAAAAEDATVSASSTTAHDHGEPMDLDGAVSVDAFPASMVMDIEDLVTDRMWVDDEDEAEDVCASAAAAIVAWELEEWDDDDEDMEEYADGDAWSGVVGMEWCEDGPIVPVERPVPVLSMFMDIDVVPPVMVRSPKRPRPEENDIAVAVKRRKMAV